MTQEQKVDFAFFILDKLTTLLMVVVLLQALGVKHG
jgi:hypothetical protein